MGTEQHDHGDQAKTLGVLFPGLDDSGPVPSRTNSEGTRRSFRWLPSAVLALVAGLLAAGLPGIVGRLGDALESVLDPTSQVKLAALQYPTCTTVVLGPNAPREHLYGWDSRNWPASGEREVTVQANAAGQPDQREAIERIDSSSSVIGYRVTSYGATIAFAEGVDVRQALDSFSIPVDWDIAVVTPFGEEP